MPCFHPLTRVTNVALNLDTGKEIGYVRSYIPLEKRDPYYKYQDIPCGQCIGCRLDYSRKWADRLMMEAKNHKHTWFITLTYNDFNLPLGEKYVPTLKKKDVQLFMKRLRKAIEPVKVRFYCSGEYGEESFRPHYHLILFGLELTDLKFYKVNELHQPYYTSEFLSRCWQDKGYVVIAPASYETMLYTSRYVTKKLKGFERVFYDQQKIEPPFSLMSRKPGIAGNNFNIDIMLDEHIMLPEGRKANHPRYFQKLLEREYPDFYDVYKCERDSRNDARMQNLLDSIEIPYLEYLAIKERNLKSRIKVLDNVKSI